jgi:hypothetical protein
LTASISGLYGAGAALATGGTAAQGIIVLIYDTTPKNTGAFFEFF